MRDRREPSWLRSLIRGAAGFLDLSGGIRGKFDGNQTGQYFDSVGRYLKISFDESAKEIKEDYNEVPAAENATYARRVKPRSFLEPVLLVAALILGLAVPVLIFVFVEQRPWYVVLGLLLPVVVFLIGKFLVLLVALKGTSPSERADVIRALAELSVAVIHTRRDPGASSDDNSTRSGVES